MYGIGMMKQQDCKCFQGDKIAQTNVERSLNELIAYTRLLVAIKGALDRKSSGATQQFDRCHHIYRKTGTQACSMGRTLTSPAHGSSCRRSLWQYRQLPAEEAGGMWSAASLVDPEPGGQPHPRCDHSESHDTVRKPSQCRTVSHL